MHRSWFSKPHPMGTRPIGNFTKIIWWKVHEMSRCTHKTSILATPTPHWSSCGVGSNTPSVFFFRIAQKIKIGTENSCSTPTHHGSWVEFNWQRYFFTKNCIKYPDLQTKVMFINPHPKRDGKMWASIFVEFLFFPRNQVKCPDLHRKHIFGNL